MTPLVLSRSFTTGPRGPIRTSQWKRETVESSTARSLSGCEPMEHVSAADSQTSPVLGPSTTVTRKRRTVG